MHRLQKQTGPAGLCRHAVCCGNARFRNAADAVPNWGNSRGQPVLASHEPPIDPTTVRLLERATRCAAAAAARRYRARMGSTSPAASSTSPNTAPPSPTDQRPEIGAPITIGKTTGRVVRHLDDGIAIEFTRLRQPDFLED